MRSKRPLNVQRGILALGARISMTALVCLVPVAGAADPNALDRWCGWDTHAGQLMCPRDVAAHPNGSVYVVDACLHRVQHFGADGALQGGWGEWGSEPGRFDTPQQIAVGPGGWLYVADTGNHRVQVFDDQGAFIGTWGTEGTQPGRFDSPRGIAATTTEIYVADAGRIQVFTPSGEWSREWATLGDLVALSVAGDGVLLGSGYATSRVERYTAEGDPLGPIRPGRTAELAPFRPTGLCSQGDNVFVGEEWTGRIQRLGAGGVLTGVWETGPESGVVAGIDVAADGTLIVADANGCVHRFTTGSPTPTSPVSWGFLKSRYP